MGHKERVVHCWEDGTINGKPATCLLPTGHKGKHKFVADDEVLITFAK